jgi:hypothetical protein
MGKIVMNDFYNQGNWMIVGIIHRENSASSGEGISDVDLPRWNCMVLSRKGLEVRI